MESFLLRCVEANLKVYNLRVQTLEHFLAIYMKEYKK